MDKEELIMQNPSSSSLTVWEEVEDPTTRRTLYYNRSTGITTFDKPDELKNMDERKRDIYLKTGIMLPDSMPEAYPDDEGKSSSIESSIQSSNVGFKMLQKMGWKEEKGLGKEEKGITVPVAATSNDGQVGLGKGEEYDKTLSEVARERRKLDVEIEQNDDVIQQRKENAQRIDKIETDLKNMHKEFYCDICNKQYINVHEMSTHLSSYDHHHKKRFKEMKESQKRKLDPTESSERQKKEAKRAAKIIRDRMNALPPPPSSTDTAPTLSSSVNDSSSQSLHTEVTDNIPIITAKKPVKFGFSMKKKPKT